MKSLMFDPSNRLRELRKELSATLVEIAGKVGTTFAQIQRLEVAERDLDLPWMRRIAPHLQVLPADLLLSKDGGLNACERKLIDDFRTAPAVIQKAILGMFGNS